MTDDAELVRQMLAKDPDDYYSILDVSPTTTDVEIKRAYKRLALAFHPDKNMISGADEAFKMVGRAFSVLGDAEKRKLYDMHGKSGLSGYPSTSSTFTSTQIDPEEIFRAFFREFAMSGDSPFNHYTSFQYIPIRRRRGFNEFPKSNYEPASPQQVVTLLVPLFVLLFLSLLNSWLIG